MSKPTSSPSPETTILDPALDLIAYAKECHAARPLSTRRKMFAEFWNCEQLDLPLVTRLIVGIVFIGDSWSDLLEIAPEIKPVMHDYALLNRCMNRRDL